MGKKLPLTPDWRLLYTAMKATRGKTSAVAEILGYTRQTLAAAIEGKYALGVTPKALEDALAFMGVQKTDLSLLPLLRGNPAFESLYQALKVIPAAERPSYVQYALQGLEVEEKGS